MAKNQLSKKDLAKSFEKFKKTDEFKKINTCKIPDNVGFSVSKEQDKIEVSIHFSDYKWHITNVEEFAPFHSADTFEEAQRYCDENNYDIQNVFGEDGEAW